MAAQKSKRRDLLIDIIHMILGSICYAIGNYCFATPNQIAPGGVAGMTTMLYALTNIPLGVWNFVLNAPLVLLAWKIVGKSFAFKTLGTIVSITLVYDTVLVHFPIFKGDQFLASLYGGVFMGIGLALMFMRGFTSGGSDIIAKVVQVYRPDFQMGQIMLIIDAVVVITSGFVFGKVESVLYAGITIFVYTRVIDIILYRRVSGKVIFVISRKGPQIARRIITECHRGVTILNGRGGYTNMGTNVLVVAMKSRDYFKLKTIADEVDENAFIIASDCGEICGNGFRPGEVHKLPDSAFAGCPDEPFPETKN